MVLTWNGQVVVLLDIMLRYERARMRFTVVAVGKLKERFWVDACAEYLKRLQPYAKTQVREIADIDPRKAGGVDGARDKEGAASVLRSRAWCGTRMWCCWPSTARNVRARGCRSALTT